MEIDGDIAEILGMHIGDGCISRTKHYAEYYLGGDIIEEKEYHDSWVKPLFNKKIAIPILNKEVIYKEHPKVRVYGFYIFDKKLVEYFESLGINSGSKINVEIPAFILNNKEWSKRFIRGLFDTDGTLYFNRNKSVRKLPNNRPVIKLGSVSSKLIKQVFDLLTNLGFHPRIRRPYQGKRDKNPVHHLLLYRLNDIERYIKEISFKNSKHYSKWEVYKRYGFCPPKTTLAERKSFLVNPKLFNPSITQ